MAATSTRTKLRESISRERRHAQIQANNTSKLVDQAKNYDVIPGMVVVMDTDHTILDLNEPAAKAAGIQKQECLGLKFWDLFDNPGCRAGICAASEAVKTGKFCEGEALPLVQGKEVPVLVSANPLFDEAGRVIGVVELVFPAAGDVGLAREIGRLVTANGEGQLSARVDESKFQGRHLDRARSINKMLNTIIQPIQEAGTVLERITKGDLTACVTGNYKGEHAEIQNYINAMTGTLRASMQSIGQNAEARSSAAEELTATSQQMSANAEETSAQANVVSASAEQVDKNLQTVATGTEEMSTSIKEIAKNAHESAKVATAPRRSSPAPVPAMSAVKRPASVDHAIDILAIGTSTGGPNALGEVIPHLPQDLPVPVVVVQHMPPLFTNMLADRLNSRSLLSVREAEAGKSLEPGQVWIARGDYHMTVVRKGLQTVLELNQDPPENSCRPAVDVLFRSVAQTYGPNVLAVVMTGMGSDGARGAAYIREAGGEVFVQDEASSVVWGMPGAVVESQCANKICPLPEISQEIVRRVLAGRTQASLSARTARV